MNETAIQEPSNSVQSEQLSSPENKIRKRISNEHAYSLSHSPRKIKKKLDYAYTKLDLLKKKLKASQQKRRRLQANVISLKSVIKCLKEKSLISSHCESILHESLSGTALDLMERVVSRKKSDKRYRYSEELRSFAITLKFYSSKAYNFVRKTLNLALPHPAQIRKWYSKVPAEPGFTEPAFDALQASVISATENNRRTETAHL